MATENKTPRILAAAKEFNIGKETLVEFLTGKGFDVNASNPNTKLSEPMYDALQAEFAKDKLVKIKSEAIALPKGNADATKKSKEDVVAAKPAMEEAPKEVAKTVEEPVVKSTGKKAKTKETDEKQPVAPKQEAVEEKDAHKVAGPNILGKINLDEINQATRPKKTTTKKAEEPVAKKSVKTAEKEVAKTTKTKKTEAAPVEEKPIEKHPEPAVEVVAPKVDPTPVEPKEPVAPAALEHIEMKSPQLSGPKIIGKIDLPVNTGNDRGRGGSASDKEKRKRKRIPVDKKPEGTPGAGSNPNAPRPAQGNQPNRPGGYNNNRPGGGAQQGNNRPGGPNNRNNNYRGNNDNRGGGTSNVPTEIDAKDIQEKIRQTQAKLAGGGRNNKNSKSKYRREKRDDMAEKRALLEQSGDSKIVQVTEFISVSEFANLLDVSFADVISKCMGLGIMVSINQRLDAEVLELVAEEFGYTVEFIGVQQEAELEEDEQDNEDDLEARAPIVTIMGHVDHGKTSLLDYIRSANVVAGEAGGITQHIGAYQVLTATGKKVTFLDTPGHEAFTAMRARGAKVADVAVIVVAADDALMPQTKEAISHAQAASLPMIFAINKIDKEGANPEKIKEQLAGMNILVEDWGGKYQSQEISAKKGLNIDLLLEKIALESELLELKANPNRAGVGSVIEASLDKGRGYVTTILVQNGTLEQGQMIVAGQHFGKVKAMFNERGQRVTQAGPSAPVQILGLNGAPQAGEKFKVYEDENEAKEVATHRAQILREQGIRARKHLTLDEIGRRLALGNFKELPIIIKGDFDGSVEALSDSLQKLSTEEVAVNVVHKAVGQITESDVLLATASDAIILGFQVRPSLQAGKLAEQENIEIRTYSIIYEAIEEIKSAMEGLLEPKVEKKIVSNIEVREVFKISGVGTIAGCYVLDGKMTRQTKLNIIREGIVIYHGELSSLKRFKDDVKEVNAGYECGLMVKNYNDIRIGDIIEGYEEVSVKRTL
ncbi:MAG: translation initiation factor IF-2 [Bacteroidota bacterium]|nr:translation initiation factor IF-2 [Bacteroidota bacterium]